MTAMVTMTEEHYDYDDNDINIGGDEMEYGKCTSSRSVTRILPPTTAPPVPSTNDCELVEIKPSTSHSVSDNTTEQTSQNFTEADSGVCVNGWTGSVSNGVAESSPFETATTDKVPACHLNEKTFIPLSPYPFRPNGESGSVQKLPPNFFFKPPVAQETLEVKRKIEKNEKKKAKKQAGWTKSENMSNHVELKDIGAILTYVGEQAEPDSSASHQTQKKKLKKKLSSKQKAENKATKANGTAGSRSTTSSDSDDFEMRHQNGVRNGVVSKVAVVSVVHSASSVSNGADDQDIDETSDISNVENDFTEVQHRKKKAPVRVTADRNGRANTYNPHPDRPPLPRHFTRTTALPQNSTVTKTVEPTKPSQSPMKIDVDLSISAFPALGPQITCDEMKHSPNQESASATDDDKDSVSSQPVSNGPSWAKIAAKPTSITPPQRQVVEPVIQRQMKSGETAPAPQKDFHEEESTSEKSIQPISADLATSIASCSSSSSVVTMDLVTSTSDQDRIEPKIMDLQSAEMDGQCSMEVSLPTIEFGTVNSSNDKQVQNILSQSYSEGFSLYSLKNVRRTASRTVKPSSNQLRVVNSKSNTSTMLPTKGAYSRGVQFLDRPGARLSPNRQLDVTFGFDLDYAASTGAFAQDNPSPSTNMSMSYPPHHSCKNAAASLLEGAASGNKAASSGSTTQSDDSQVQGAKTLNILHKIMSLPCNHHKIQQQSPALASTGKGDDLNSHFDVWATIKMLKKEFEIVMQQCRKNGHGRIKYLTAELPRSN